MQHTRPTGVLFAFALTIFGLQGTAGAVVVTNTSDVLDNPGCAITGTGSCTLRDALTFTNGSGGGTISFNIPGGGVHTIAPLTFLPPIAGATMIDGYSQPGATKNTATIQNGTNAALMIELDLTHTAGLIVTGDFAVLQGLVINRAFGPGMTISGKNVQVLGNFVGTNPTGTASGPGNSGDGIAVVGIGDLIGGNTDDARNLISGNANAGIRVSGAGVLNAVVSNNLIGTNAAGTAALANLTQGVVISGQGHLVGLGPTSQGNVISGNVSSGVLVATALISATIAGNNIGANAAGTAPLGNGTGGVTDGITVNSSFVMIGGATAAEGNVIGGSAVNGILINGNSNQIYNNRIGLLPNGGANGNANAGISLAPFSSGNKIGAYGGTPGFGNTITNSGLNGIEIHGAGVTGGTGNSIIANSIFANGGLGIKLGSGSSPTPNDAGDADTGPNHLQNYPVITAASVAGGLINFSFTLNSLANRTYLFSGYSSTGCDPSGYGEGQTYYASFLSTTDGSGNFSISGLVLGHPPGEFALSLTAEDTVDGSTSEFSQCVLASPPALASAVSRKVHGGAGTFNLPLSIVASGVNHNPTTEPRQSSTSTIVMTFDQPVVSASVAVTEGTATVGAVTFSGPDVIVPLTGVLDHQYVTVSATNVASAFTSGGTGSVRIGFLLGDVNQNRVVAVSDLGLVNAQLAQPVSAVNYLKDVNATGTLTVADKGITNSNLTKALPPP